MPVEIFRVNSATTSCLQNVDPDVFDNEVDLEKVAALVAADNHILVVGRENGLVIGQIRAILHLQPDGPNQLYIDNLGVAQTHLRQGIASLLLEEVLLWGKANGCGGAWVATEIDNDAARGLYNKFISEPEEQVAYFQLAIR